MAGLTFMCLDIETNGIGRFRPPTQRAVQISWICSDGTERDFFVSGITEISKSPTYPCTHITPEVLQSKGIPFTRIWDVLKEDLKDTDLIVTHNVKFDIGILYNELKLHKLYSEMPVLRMMKKKCTMECSEKFCALPKTGKGAKFPGFKWPKLEELHVKLFNTKPEGTLHDSLVDCRVLKKCYEKGLEMGIF